MQGMAEGILAHANLGVLKEPRGFIKVLQFVFSICAFATTTSFSTYFSFNIICDPNSDKVNATITEEITYPYQLDRIHTPYHACGASQRLYVMGDLSSDAKFFVAVGVLAFLYVLVALGLYCFFNALYENKDLVPIGDFALHVVFAFLWLAASCAWANSLTGLRNAATLDNIISYNNEVCGKHKCDKVTEARFGQLISSVIFGFLNVFIWGSNLWFLYKETRFYRDRKAGEAANGTN